MIWTEEEEDDDKRSRKKNGGLHVYNWTYNRNAIYYKRNYFQFKFRHFFWLCLFQSALWSGRLYAEFTVFFLFFLHHPIISYIIFFRLECGQMIVHGTCLIYIFTTQCNNIEQSSEISKWTPSYQIKYEIFWQKKTAPKMKYHKNISYREPIEWIDEYWDGIKWWKQKQNARIENERSNK